MKDIEITMQIESSTTEELASEITNRLNSLPDRSTENVRAMRREFSKRLSQAEPQEVIALALRLLEPENELRFVAYELVHHHWAALRSLGEQELAQLGQGIDSWEDVDTFACYLSGPAWREHQVPDALIQQWARSTDRWWRRASLVSTVALNNKARGGSGDANRTLLVCEMLVEDHDDMVYKAMSWALRELIKHDPQAVREFLQAHQGVLAPRVVREVQNKLSTGLKNPRRK
jgi:3-methyladenine DNA glycosylase AlkD